MFRFSKSIAALLAVMSIGSVAQADDFFGTQEQIAKMQAACLGKSQSISAMLYMAANGLLGHPVLSSRNVIVMFTTRRSASWTESYIADPITDQLESQLRAKMDKATTCYGSSGELLNYWDLGVSGAFNQHSIFAKLTKDGRFGGGYNPPSKEISELYDACTPDAPKPTAGVDGIADANFVNNRVRAITGHATILQPSMIGETNDYVLSEMLTKSNPTTCADINAINGTLIDRYMTMDRLLRADVLNAGYTFKETN